MKPTLRTALWICVLLGLLLRVGLALRDLDTVDRLFIPDDTYYTLSVARSLAAGKGPTVDGVHLTSGFQPLLGFLLAPAYRASADPDLPLRLDLLLLALVDASNALLLALLARRLAGSPADLAAAAAWSFSPVALANALGGLETALAILTSLALTELWCRARERQSTRAYLSAGVLAGLALLARVDTVFLVGLLGAFELIGRQRAKLLWAVLAAVIVVAPWWSYSLAVFGTIIPESGAAVREQVLLHQQLYLGLLRQLAWAAGSIIGPPFIDAAPFREFLFAHGGFAAAVAALLLAVLGYGAWRVLRQAERISIAPLGALLASGVVIWLFYALVLPAAWFFRRYLAPTHVLVTLLLSAGVAKLWNRRGELSLLARMTAGAYGCGVLLGLALCTHLLLARPLSTIDTGLEGAKGYREVARDILQLTRPGMVLGALQSGALGYYGQGKLAVINLDGVVSGAARHAVQRRELDVLARSAGVTHLADWLFNLRAFKHFSRPTHGIRYRLVGKARPQGPDRTLLVEIVWPEDRPAR